MFAITTQRFPTMSKTNTFAYWGLYAVAWLIFVGLCIEAGGFIVNFIFSLHKPELVSRLYQKLDLTEMYRQSKLAFYGVNGFILCIAMLKTVLFYIVIRMMHKMDLKKPFNFFSARQISLISYYTLSIGILSYVAKRVTMSLMHYGFVPGELSTYWEDDKAFIVMGAVVYIIATIFKKGVEIQIENDLTI